MESITVGSLAYPITLGLSAIKGNVTVSILSSVFIDSTVSSVIHFVLTAHFEGSHTSVLIRDTDFINSNVSHFHNHTNSPVLFLHTITDVTSIFTLNNVYFIGNSRVQLSNGGLYIVSNSSIEVYMINVNFIYY